MVYYNHVVDTFCGYVIHEDVLYVCSRYQNSYERNAFWGSIMYDCMCCMGKYYLTTLFIQPF